MQDIRKLLPRGYVKLVSDKLKVSCFTVYRVAKGEVVNRDVYLSLVQLAGEELRKKKEIEEGLNKINQQL